ncbi:MAG TPA: type II CAAX endopeptidase family protein [Steroidobacteraceae bacterium]|jgi:membrane protease YdiL (CAAX protease family)|nr:type II CAAX endopeptidase family protein [Steroidobacteraceae bacterium]
MNIEANTATTWRARALQNPFVRILLALLSIAIPFAMVATPFNLFVSDKSLKRLGALLLTAIVLGAYSGYVRIIERRSVNELSGSRMLRELGAGILLGALLFCMTIGLLAALGVYHVTGTNGWMVVAAVLPGFILSGVLEEVVMRGIVFRILEHSFGSWLGLAVSAAIFGLLHLLNPGTTLLNAGCVMVEAGVLLAAAYMVTRRLWFCIGLHIAWNFTEGGIFSAVVSGGDTKGLLQARFAGPDWLTGGAFGAEGSVVALAICAAAGILLVAQAVRKGNVVRPFWSAKRSIRQAA